MKLKSKILRWVKRVMLEAYPEIIMVGRDLSWDQIDLICEDSTFGTHTKIYQPSHIFTSTIGDYTYVSINARISMSTIGKFCSIGPNFVCGWGIHPINGLSTSPMFYSTSRQNGMTMSDVDKIEERKPVTIGNDVFIGANVTVLDGVTIGDGAVIGAGAVVSKDIPPYAVAVGCPIHIIKYRFEAEKIEALKKIEWWNFEEERLKEVEKYFFDVNRFIELEQSKAE